MNKAQPSVPIARQNTQDMAQTYEEILSQSQAISEMSLALNAAMSQNKAKSDLKSALLKTVSESIKDIKNLA
jgi:hypothetical protein